MYILHTNLKKQFLWGIILALVSLLVIPFETARAEIPTFTPGPSSFPYAGSSTGANPSSSFPYASQGLEEGLNAVENKLPQGIQKQRSGTQLIKDWINYFLQFYMYVTVGLLMYYGLQIILARDKPDKRKEVITVVINIFIGTLLMVFAYAIIIAVVNLLTPGELKSGVTGSSAPTSTTTAASAPTSTTTATADCTQVNEVRNLRANFYAYPRTPDSVIVSWTACRKAGYTIKSYVLGISEDGGATWKAQPLDSGWIRDNNADSQRIYFNGQNASELRSPLNPANKRYTFTVEMHAESNDGNIIEDIPGPLVDGILP